MWMAMSFALLQTGPLDFARDFPESGHSYVDVRSAYWAGRSLAFMVVSSEAVQKDALLRGFHFSWLPVIFQLIQHIDSPQGHGLELES